MFKRSRRKITALVMITLFCILAVMLCVIYFTTFREINLENRKMLETYAELYEENGTPGESRDEPAQARENTDSSGEAQTEDSDSSGETQTEDPDSGEETQTEDSDADGENAPGGSAQDDAQDSGRQDDSNEIALDDDT